MAKKRKQFNSSGPFVVRGKMLMSGVNYPHGAEFPMDGITPRRLRQLWDLRRIEMAPRSIFEELMEGVKEMADAREQAAPELDPQTIFTQTDIVIVDSKNPVTISLADLSDDDLFARAKTLTGISYRVRARAIKALESL